MKQTTKNTCYKTLPEKELDDISFRRRRESTRGLKVSGRQMADIPDAEVADPEVGNGPTTGNRGCIRAVHGIVVIYQVEGGEGGWKESRRRAALTSRVLILVYRAKRERDMVSNGVQPFLRDYLRSANFIPVKRARINEPWKRIVLQGDSERYDARCPDSKFGRCFLNVSRTTCSARNFYKLKFSRFRKFPIRDIEFFFFFF